jgi:hypothetical protein
MIINHPRKGNSMILQIIFGLLLLISFLTGCLSNETDDVELSLESVNGAVLTLIAGELEVYELWNEYKVTNIGSKELENAILKVNVYLNGKIIKQELIDINPIGPNNDNSVNMSFYYYEHKEGNIYQLNAEIIIDYKIKNSLISYIQ